MPSPIRLPSGPDPALLAEWQRAHHHAAALFASLDKLDELGGPALLAAQQGWSVDALDRAIGLLEARRRHYPRRRRIG